MQRPPPTLPPSLPPSLPPYRHITPPTMCATLPLSMSHLLIKVSEDVAAGKYGSPVSEQLVGEMEVAAAAAGEGGEGAGVAVKEAPLCVRVQALPKASRLRVCLLLFRS